MAHPQPTPVIRETAQQLVEVLYDEVPLVDPIGMNKHFIIWLTDFRYLNADQINRPNGHYLVKRAGKEAVNFYRRHMKQSFHSWQDKTKMFGILSRALLLSCGCFERTMTDNPLDLLRPEALHSGYYACLYNGAGDLFYGQGIPDLSYDPAMGFCPLLDPFLPLN